MSRRTIVAFVLGALLAASAPALADHINEPTWPIERLDLWVGHYSTGTRVECRDGQIGTWPSEFVRLRANAYIDASSRPGGEPSEHFDVTQTIMFPWDPERNRGGLYEFDRWRHQNIPPHAAQRWQIDSTSIDVLRPAIPAGFWKIHYLVEGRESGVDLEQECVFEVVPEE